MTREWDWLISNKLALHSDTMASEEQHAAWHKPGLGCILELGLCTLLQHVEHLSLKTSDTDGLILLKS